MSISFSTSIHAAPASVRSMPENSGSVTVCFTEGGFYPEVTMYCGSAEMAIDLHKAIASVIEKHRQPVAAEQEDAA